MQVLERENLYMIICQSDSQIFTEQPDKSKTVPSFFILGILCGKCELGTSLVVQWLRIYAPNAGGPSSIPGQGTKSHMLQRRLKILRATGETWCSQISKYIFFLSVNLQNLLGNMALLWLVSSHKLNSDESSSSPTQ